MVILIKLNNGTETSGTFTNYFQQSIEVAPFSKIALLNASIGTTSTVYEVIKDFNDELQYKISSNGDLKTVKLTAGLYTLSELTNHLTFRLNDQLFYTGKTIESGMQWKCDNIENADGTNHVTISINRDIGKAETGSSGTALPKFFSDDLIFKIVNANQEDNSFRKPDIDDDSWSSAVSTKTIFGSGSSIVYMRLPNATTECAIGLTRFNNIEDRDKYEYDNDTELYSYVPKNYDMCVFTYQDTTSGLWYYGYYDNGEEVETEEGVNSDEYFGIMHSGGSYKFFFSRLQPDDSQGVIDQVILHEREDNDEVNFYYGMASCATRNGLMQEPRMISDPYHTVEEDYEHYNFTGINKYNMRVGKESGLGTSAKSSVTILMDKIVLNLLGFTDSPLTTGGSVENFTWVAKNKPKSVLPTNLKIVLDHLPLMSYDSKKRAQQSILMTIPTISYDDDSKIVYNASQPVFIDLNNKEPFTLNEVFVRLLTFNNESVTIASNNTDITILIEK